MAWTKEQQRADRKTNPEKYRRYERSKRDKGLPAFLEKRRRAVHKFHGYPQPTRPRPNCCECCGRDVSMDVKALALDHCHTTGLFRGWLCLTCNLGIGRLGDTIEALERGIAYLKRAQEQWSHSPPSPLTTSSPKSDS